MRATGRIDLGCRLRQTLALRASSGAGWWVQFLLYFKVMLVVQPPASFLGGASQSDGQLFDCCDYLHAFWPSLWVPASISVTSFELMLA